MNHQLKHFVIKRKWLVKLINGLFNLKNRTVFDRIIEERKLLSVFNYVELAESIPYAPREIVIDNNLYGIAHALKKYANLDVKKSLNGYIEHGIFFGNLVREDEKIYPLKNVITYGAMRVKHLKASGINKDILPIGPFIHYAVPLLEGEEFYKLKKELGRVLLVFPSHSIIGVDSDYDQGAFINKIEKIRSDYDSVLVSLYWTDALKPEIVRLYESFGYKIVSSGHRFDLNFLSRQRSIIELADFTISNSVGTHVGYCIYLNKPHYIYRQEIKYNAHNEKLKKHFDAVRTKENWDTLNEELEELHEIFCNEKVEITEIQRKVVDKYWGISYLRSPEELRSLLN